MASNRSLFLILLFLLSAISVAGEDLSLGPAEQEAVYLALESIDPFTDWRSLYPGDLCLYGPHGVVCDVGESSSELHVIEINLGFVSDVSSNPNCSQNATLPYSLSALPFLRKIFFYNCFSSSKTIFESSFVKNLSSAMREIVFINNPALVGRISGSIGNFSNLRRLIITNSAVSGSVPIEIGDLQNLSQLVLSGNRLRGPIPASIGSLNQLMILDLSGNRISGGVPTQIGRLSELVKLDLSGNRISGPVPVEIGRLKNVEFLDLSFNKLTGGVPTAIGRMVSLKEVYLSGNALGGQIPEIWETLKGILGIGMSKTGLVGNIPASMGVFLENLCYLGLDGNFLEGELPEQFKRLEATASEINVENNRLRGRIPFSAGFVWRLGGKLKVGGNGNLCLGEELVGHVRSTSSVGELELCNKTEIPRAVLFSSGASFLKGRLFWVVLVIQLWFCLFVRGG
ncbi:uncharacterized protein A4U43_C01F7990 [Asparagus officinalis]|uniref:Leucine-rich repeat-containing N-terminal plant-type domain-containing protein n=1 Tax=Asparagus officinalis TaxID=4686 RepID=A0A5P1FQA8_ASPOF|nr:piriformospora indica-insensitive protein 2-like [Asparagus officinalis]ONK79597.1 uncharacterized protein A4U43_C01F7990 [Asparagus officinalis]